MVARFPRRRPDGTFVVEVTVEATTSTPEDLVARFGDWAQRWVYENAQWHWPSGRHLNYFDDFVGPPREIKFGRGRLSFRLDGKADAKWWKDWLAFRLLREAQIAFPELGRLEGIVDRSEASP